MIRVRCEGMTLSLQGHAGAAPHGQDLVCAAVTGLVYALAQRLAQWDTQGAMKQPPTIQLTSGSARISAVPKDAYIDAVQEDFCLVQSGLTLLAQHYPEQIQI